MTPHESIYLITEVYKMKNSTQDLVTATFEYAGKQKVTRQKFDYATGVYTPYDGKQNLYVVIIRNVNTNEVLFTSKPYSEGCITNIYRSSLVKVIDEIYNS